jgi:hypothetical protein
MSVYKGPFQIDCTTNRSPNSVLSDILKSLENMKITFSKVSDYFLKCSKTGIKFEVELCRMENIENIHVVRMKRLDGDVQKYREVCNKALGLMNL